MFLRPISLQLWGLLILAMCLSSSFGLATADGSPEQAGFLALPEKTWSDKGRGPLCGVYAACRALQLVGIKTLPEDFVSARYVGRSAGSSPTELARLIEDAGANSTILNNLSGYDLRLFGAPMIANVRSRAGSDRFDHWVTAIPQANGVTIYDGANELHSVSMAHFLGIWSGLGILVTKDSMPAIVSVWAGRALLAIFATSCFGCLYSIQLRWREGEGQQKVRTLPCIAAIVATSVLLAIIGNLCFGDPHNHAEGVLAATANGRAKQIKRGSIDSLLPSASHRKTLLVDARFSDDYRRGTIEGAMNVPVSASTWEIKEYVAAVDREVAVVVFCQSAKCAFDESIALELASLGFNSVAICEEGWVEYARREGT